MQPAKNLPILKVWPVLLHALAEGTFEVEIEVVHETVAAEVVETVVAGHWVDEDVVADGTGDVLGGLIIEHEIVGDHDGFHLVEFIGCGNPLSKGRQILDFKLVLLSSRILEQRHADLKFSIVFLSLLSHYNYFQFGY